MTLQTTFWLADLRDRLRHERDKWVRVPDPRHPGLKKWLHVGWREQARRAA